MKQCNEFPHIPHKASTVANISYLYSIFVIIYKPQPAPPIISIICLSQLMSHIKLPLFFKLQLICYLLDLFDPMIMAIFISLFSLCVICIFYSYTYFFHPVKTRMTRSSVPDHKANLENKDKSKTTTTRIFQSQLFL